MRTHNISSAVTKTLRSLFWNNAFCSPTMCSTSTYYLGNPHSKHALFPRWKETSSHCTYMLYCLGYISTEELGNDELVRVET